MIRNIPFAILFLFFSHSLWAQFLNPRVELLGSGELNTEAKLVQNQVEHSNRYPWAASMALGLGNHAQIDVEYGSQVSLGAQALLWSEGIYFPQVTLGLRNLFGSFEAEVFGIESDSLVKKYQSEVYFNLSKKFSKTLFSVGGSFLPLLDDQGLFWTVKQGLWKGLFVDYEGFFREEVIHHNLGMGFRFGHTEFKAGFLELQDWFWQNEKFGFYTDPAEKYSSNAIRSPGLYLSMSFTGPLWREEVPTSQLVQMKNNPEKLNEELLKKLIQLEKNQQNFKDTLLAYSLHSKLFKAEIEKDLKAQSAESKDVPLRRYMDNMVSWLNAGGDAEPEKLKSLQDSLKLTGLEQEKWLKIWSLDSNETLLFRELSIQMAGKLKLKNSSEWLQVLSNAKEPSLRKEALIALSYEQSEMSLKIIQNHLQDSDVVVAKVAESLLKNAAENKTNTNEGALGKESSNQAQLPSLDTQNSAKPTLWSNSETVNQIFKQHEESLKKSNSKNKVKSVSSSETDSKLKESK